MAERDREQKTSRGAPVAFISYASQDAAVANSVVEALEKAGLRCWIAPRDVVPGDIYADAIVRAIDAAKIVVLTLSQNATGSPHVLREVERASSKRHPIVSFRIDLAALPTALEYFLNTSQWLDASATGVERALPKLVGAVRHTVTTAYGADLDHGSGPAVPALHQAQPRSTDAKAIWFSKRAVIVVAAIIVVGIAYGIVDRLWQSKRAPEAQQSPTATTTTGDKSIAVLPFEDVSEHGGQGYFADGMAEEMVNVLGTIPQLKVIGRASSFQFKGQNADLSAIGEKLGAAYLLRGSVRRGGSRIRVSAQLVDAGTGTQLWADSYDRELGDVLALQAQIASNIARALQLAVVVNDAQQLRRLNSPEAYALYLRGRSAYDRGDDAGLREAQADFEQVLTLEPTFSRAAEALALTHLSLIGASMVPSRLGWPHAVDAAKLALRLDAKSAFAHAILGLKLATYDYDWAAAGHELERAMAVESRDPVVLYNCSWLAFDLGRIDEALRLQEAAQSLDPLNPDSLQNGAIIYYLLGRFDLAERGFRKSIEISPTFEGNHKYLGQILLLQGRSTDALKEMEADGPGNRDVGLALVYHALGRRVESDTALGRVLRGNVELLPTSIATIYAYRGEFDRAFIWLEKAIAERDIALGHKLEHDPLLTPLRSDPRYLRLLREMHLSE